MQVGAWARRAVLAVVVIGAVAAFFAAGLQHDVTLTGLQLRRAELVQFRGRHEVGAAAAYFGAYVAMAAMAIPGSLVMTLAGGAVFGLAEGVVLASFGSSIGAVLALLGSRFLFRGWVERRFRGRLAQVDRGLARDGWVYLASLRLVPAIPFFVVDLLFGVTAFPVRRFYVVSQAAMLPATLVYVNAGTQIERLTTVSGILSPGVVGSLLLLACLPVAVRFGVRAMGAGH